MLFTSVCRTVAAVLFVFFLAKLDGIKLNGQAQGILTVLVFGAGTDYALLSSPATGRN